MDILTLEDQATIRRIAGRILRRSELQSAARYQALVLAGTQAARAAKAAYCENAPALAPALAFRELMTQRIHWAVFDALRSFAPQALPAKAAA